MPNTNLKTIIDLLPKLDPSDLRQIKARCDFFLRGSSKQTSDLANEECLHQTITEKYPAVGLYQLRKSESGLYKKFKSAVNQLHEVCEKFGLNPHESRDFYQLSVNLAAISLQGRKIPISFTTIIGKLNNIWELLERSYPGYGTNPEFFRKFVLEPFGQRSKT